jgi:cytochrome oxidase assembly protein ShyY1
VPGDLSIVSGRVNHGATGFWVVGHIVSDAGPSVAVALGWAEKKSAAEAAISALAGGAASATIVGRYLPSETPQDADFEHGQRNTVSVAALVNEWATVPAQTYGGYMVARAAPAGLEAIDSPSPDESVQLNWLNIFYAIEWAIFAGFAIYLWYRLVRDAWERELEESAEVN